MDVNPYPHPGGITSNPHHPPHQHADSNCLPYLPPSSGAFYPPTIGDGFGGGVQCSLTSSYICLPPNVDPATVDFRTFFPYNASEVQLRKRRSTRRISSFREEPEAEQDRIRQLRVFESQDQLPAETPQELDITDPQNISNLRVDSDEVLVSTCTSVVIEPDNGLVHETPAPVNSRAFVCTPFSLLVSAVIIGIGVPKAIASHRGEEVVANDLDWIIGVPVAFASFWLGVLKEQGSLTSLKWFLHDDFRDILIPPSCRS